jgi:uncharacterized membrane protein YgdD (TMEM256/DUF423 family)
MNKNILAISTGLFVLAIALGAFGAHGLKSLIEADQIYIFEVGVRYQFFTSLALMILAFNFYKLTFSLKWVLRLVGVGITMFSGSIYLLSLSDYIGISSKLIGPLTPVGGMLMITGWGIFIFKLVRS